MSAWIVSRQHIDVMVDAAIRRGLVEPSQADEVGRMLWKENLASVAHRYPRDKDGERPGPTDFRDADVETYTFTPLPKEIVDVWDLNPDGALRVTVDCYDYQSCEHPGWRGSAAHALCCRLRELAGGSREYDERIPWRWEAPCRPDTLKAEAGPEPATTPDAGACTTASGEEDVGRSESEESAVTARQDNYKNLTRLLAGASSREIVLEGQPPLSVAWVEGEPLITLCQYDTVNGDLVRKGEVVFLVEEEGRSARPIYYRCDYNGFEHATVEGYLDDYCGVVPVEPARQEALEGFVAEWWKYIEASGFFEKAEELREQQVLSPAWSSYGEELQRLLRAAGQWRAVYGPGYREPQRGAATERVGEDKGNEVRGQQQKGNDCAEVVPKEELTTEPEGKSREQVSSRDGDKSKGVVTLEQGSIRAWVHDNGPDRQPTFSVARICKDEQSGQWKYSQSFTEHDLGDLARALKKATRAIKQIDKQQPEKKHDREQGRDQEGER
jgi:hypothetical protein